MSKSKNKKRSSQINNTLAVNLIKGFSSGIISFIILLAVFSLVILKTDIQSSDFYTMVLISSGGSALICASFSTISATKSKLLNGMLATIIVIVLEFLILLCFNNANLSVKIYLLFPISIITGFMGCVIGSNIRRRK